MAKKKDEKDVLIVRDEKTGEISVVAGLQADGTPRRTPPKMENAQDFLDWCRTHGTDPSDESAEFYVEQTDINLMDRQVINDEDYGVWN